MAGKADIAKRTRDTLRDIGFSLIQRDYRIPSSRNARLDLLAWAPDESGALVPWAAIELKAKHPAKPDLLLPALARSRDLLGTRDHYVLVNGQWFKADRGVRSLEHVEGPTLPPHGGHGILRNEDLATDLLTARLMNEAGRSKPSLDRDGFVPDDLLYDTAVPGIQLSEDDFIPVEFDVLRRARRRAIVSYFVAGKSTGFHASDPVIAASVATLVGDRLGGTIFDPFCGTGSFLWAVTDRAQQNDERVNLVGFEKNSLVAEAAAAIGRNESMPTSIETVNAFETRWPQAHVIVSAPPLGFRLQEPHPLQDGSTTNEAEVRAIDLSVASLDPGGRAVLHVGVGFTYHAKLERYRQYLASEFRVAALIGLPPGVIPGTSIRSVLLVVDRSEPGETFIAQLGEDWRTELSVGGAAIDAALEHLDGNATPASGKP